MAKSPKEAVRCQDDRPKIFYLGSGSNQEQLKNADHRTEESKDEPLVNQGADQDR